jgi:hypothetical protein
MAPYEIEQTQTDNLPIKTSYEISRTLYQAKSSFAVPGCLSRIMIFVHPGSRKQQQHQKDGEIFFVLPFFVATNIIKF